jgi:hypothetical protein
MQRSSSTSQQRQQEEQQQRQQQQQQTNLMALAVSSGNDECIEAVAEALLQQRFSPASVLLHLHDALEALRATPRHRRLFLQLLRCMPLLDLGEVEVARGRVLEGRRQECRCGGQGRAHALRACRLAPA